MNPCKNVQHRKSGVNWSAYLSKMWSNCYSKHRFNTFEGIGAPQCKVCTTGHCLGSVSVGLAAQKRRLPGVKLVLIWSFYAYKPMCMDCTLLHNGGRSTVWYAYPKEEWAVLLRDPLLFTFRACLPFNEALEVNCNRRRIKCLPLKRFPPVPDVRLCEVVLVCWRCGPHCPFACLMQSNLRSRASPVR